MLDINFNLKAQTSIHFVLSSDYNFTAWKRPFKFVAEAYYKYLDNLIPYQIDNVRITYSAKNNARGYASGVDMKVNGEFVKPHAKDAPFNTPGDNYGGVTFSLDNKHLFITVCKANKKGYVNCDIYSSDLNREDEWGPLKNLGTNVNTEDGWEAQPSLSSDGKTLIFAGARADGKGMDLYKTERENTNAEWQPAVNMGPQINTDKNEKSPFIHSDSQTLYFTSDGWPGIGGYDIFFTKMKDDGTWNTPKNIGIPINTEKDEVGFFVSTDGKKGYFASNSLKGIGGYDIYEFDLPEKVRPEKVLFVKGKVEGDKEAIASAKIELKNASGKRNYDVSYDTITGKYASVVAFNDDFILTVKKQGYAYNSAYFSKDDSTLNVPQKVNLQLKKTEIGQSYKLNNILFSSNSSELNMQDKNILTDFSEYLKLNQSLKFTIEGHTDNSGNALDNLKLSEDRAKAVFDFLSQCGIDKSRLSFKGFGANKPVASNDNEEGKALNRRTEFVILSK